MAEPQRPADAPEGPMTVAELRELLRGLPDGTEVWTYDHGMPQPADVKVWPHEPGRVWIG